MKRKRRNHSASFKAKVAVAAIRGDKTLAELSEQFDVHQNQIQDWRRKLLDHADQVFGRGGSSPSKSEHKVKDLHAKIGQLRSGTRPDRPGVASRARLGASSLPGPDAPPAPGRAYAGDGLAGSEQNFGRHYRPRKTGNLKCFMALLPARIPDFQDSSFSPPPQAPEEGVPAAPSGRQSGGLLHRLLDGIRCTCRGILQRGRGQVRVAHGHFRG